jgi:hypothetical protein
MLLLLPTGQKKCDVAYAGDVRGNSAFSDNLSLMRMGVG